MARIGFGVASLASLAFVVWFLVANIESPGLSFAVALVVMPLLLTLFGYSKTRKGISKDARGAGWFAIALVLAGVAYIAVFFSPWLIVAMVWLCLHIPLGIGLVSSPSVPHESRIAPRIPITGRGGASSPKTYDTSEGGRGT